MRVGPDTIKYCHGGDTSIVLTTQILYETTLQLTLHLHISVIVVIAVDNSI